MFREIGSLPRLAAAIAEIQAETPPENALPSEDVVTRARETLIPTLPTEGLGLEATIRHLRQEIVPGFNGSSRSSNYYGFVTGGSTPAATLADNLVTAYDQNTQVHLPNETVATDLEDRALTLLCELLQLDPSQWPHRTFTTGATSSNVLGLACGREYIFEEVAAVRSDATISIGEIGIFEAMHRSGINKIQILTTVPHSSLSKAASILGLGRAAVRNIGLESHPHKFDMPLLSKLLEDPSTASIVAISASEVNTGLFATSGLEEMQEIRKLCDVYGAWIHVDGAFGLMGRLLSSPDYGRIIRGCEGLELADSITGDGHKLLNVPYDCGFFLSRHREIASRVFQNPNAAYLSAGADEGIMSPLNIGLENSRRLRALPVYASLAAYGRDGYREMLERQIILSRGIAEYILDSEHFELLPQFESERTQILQNIYIIVLFRAKDDGLNDELVNRIKGTKKVYVSGTAWAGKPACRFAVSNWMADVNKDLPIIKGVFEDVISEWQLK
ncbi:pyridoxal-dependent decarboxylase [Aaosphaeria arxii CBS 175.79]|uniref:Pyridoxal-dependent decarboxylase n=1 Tax=Aaosphaeria arxii CBS 175.79 TaxID=1450172 RepID=A0A6A5XZQ8_9PLEO|nr:pyridoxal-dependent decarboxylase [Aaosphaeria arxii CBS 175.79]KAF2018403.1 pyridoxal-dependent decarboxylase [Aaosphaeria arxii CBS 175.79]